MECVAKELPHRTGWGLTIFFCCFQSHFQFVTAYLGSAPLVPLLDIRLLRQAKRDQQVWDNILTYRIQQAPSCLAGQIKVSGSTVQHNAHRLQLIFLSSGVALDCGESRLRIIVFVDEIWFSLKTKSGNYSELLFLGLVSCLLEACLLPRLHQDNACFPNIQ